jgi:hypothetical protein
MKYIAMLLALLMVAGAASATQIVLKERVSATDLLREGMTQATIDDLTMSFSGDPVSGLTALNLTGNSTWALVVGKEGNWQEGLVGLANLTSYIPVPSSLIESATFRIRQRSPSYVGEEFGVYRVLTPWMYNAPGANETVVTATIIIPGDEPWKWGDGTADFTSADYTTVDGGAFTITTTTSNTPYDVDITDIVKGWVDDPSTNNGLLVYMTNWYSGALWDGDTPYFHPSEDGLIGPTDARIYSGVEFIINYVPEPATMALLAAGGIALLRRRPAVEDGAG